MSPVCLLLALLPTPPEPADPLDAAAHAIPVDGGLMPTAELTDAPRRRTLGAKTLFVNFDGGQMNFCGDDDPAGNCSTIFNGVVLPYSGDAVKRASVIQVIRKRVADFGITVTDTRPESGDYDMEMVGNWQGEEPGFAGVAPNIDCFDNDGGETSFTLEASGSADGIAEIVLQELAHTWGLEHVDEGTDLLFPTTSGSNKTFIDECFQIVSDTTLNPSSGICNSVHSQFCGSAQQNSYQELLLVFGESIPDTIAPTVSIISPEDGATIEGDVDLVIEFADDQQPVVISATITITSDALPEQPEPATGAYAGPSMLNFPITNLPAGEYTIVVEGVDESDNPASDEITITINDPASADESGDDASSADDDGTDDGPADDDDGSAGDDDDDGADDDSSGSATADQDDGAADRGCACGVDGSRDAWAAFGLFVLALAGVRRRRATILR